MVSKKKSRECLQVRSSDVRNGSGSLHFTSLSEYIILVFFFFFNFIILLFNQNLLNLTKKPHENY